MASMFEGPIHAAKFAASEDSPSLRQLRWTDLVARIAAARGVRPVMPSFEEPDASFAAFHRDLEAEGQQRVNRDDLSRGKADGLSTRDAAKSAGDGDDREIP
jgi:hypothetical protein